MKLLTIAAFYLCLISSLSAWTPPIGIPEPTWGKFGNPIEAATPTPPLLWTENLPGIYYVEEGGTNEREGFPGKPRPAIPNPIPAGSVIFVNGKITRDHGQFTVKANGTEMSPVWICAYNPDNPPVFTKKFNVNGASSFLLIDGLVWDWAGSGNGKFEISAGVNHLAIRNVKTSGMGSLDGTDGSVAHNQSAFVFYNPASYGTTEQIVLYKVKATLGGNWKYASGDPDAHGLSMGVFTQDVWVMDSEFSYFSGNGIQIGAGTAGRVPDSNVCRKIYVGRCLGHHIAQTAFWAKRSDTVIFSQCIAHSMRRDAPSSPNSGGFGSQYGARNFWVIFCEVYNCQTAVGLGSNSLSSGASATPIYFVGNLFHDIHDLNGGPDTWRTTLYALAGTAIHIMGSTGVVAVNNTITDVDAGILLPSNIPLTAEGNIISDVNPSGVSIATAGSTGTIDRNIMTTPYLNWGGARWASVDAITAGTGNISTPPQFEDTNDFRLKAGSPGIDAAGASVPDVYATYKALTGLDITVDHNGAIRPQDGKWDIGAYEFSTGGTVAPSNPKGLRVKKGD